MSTHTLPNSALRSASANRLRSGLMLSGAVHVGIVAALIFWSSRPEPLRPPVYRVNLVGAPPGERQIGVVNDRPAPPKPSDKPVPSGVEQVKPPEKTLPTVKNTRAQQQVKATPTPTRSRTAGAKDAAKSTTAAAPPKAGSGSTGGKGADVANIRVEGIAFPDQGYLNNIMRQMRLNWHPRDQSGARVAEVKFTIRRDGSIIGIEVVKASGDRSYDYEAIGAIEAVGNNRLLGPLPAVWTDDVLIVYFTFDYALLK